jgi:hypothetical protein
MSRTLSRRLSAAVVALTLLSAATVAAQPAEGKAQGLSPAEQKLTKHITIDAIKRYTAALAADDMEGRGTGQPGGDKAATWLASEFKRLGMAPLGDKGSYLQSVPFTQSVTPAASTFKVGGHMLTLGTEWATLALPSDTLMLNADLVFVGYGVVDEALHRNDPRASIPTARRGDLPDRPANVSEAAWLRLE